jgi:hypothetical protein
MENKIHDLYSYYNNLEKKYKNEKNNNDKKKVIKINVNNVLNNNSNISSFSIENNIINQEFPNNKLKSIVKKISPKLSGKIIDYSLYEELSKFNLDSQIILNKKNKKKVTFNF